MVGEAIAKKLITSKNPVKKLRQNPEIIKKLSTYNHNVKSIKEMNIDILDLSLEIIQESAKIRNNEGVLTNDSLMLATMKKHNIGKLITNDADFDNITWIEVYKPSDIWNERQLTQTFYAICCGGLFEWTGDVHL